MQELNPKWFVEVLFYLADNLASWVLWIKCVCCKSWLIRGCRPVDQDKRSEAAHALLSLWTNFGKLHVLSRSDLPARLFQFTLPISSLFPLTHLASWRFVGAPMGLTRPTNCEMKNGKRLLLLKRKSSARALTCQVMHPSTRCLLIEEKECCYFLLVSTRGEAPYSDIYRQPAFTIFQLRPRPPQSPGAVGIPHLLLLAAS